MFHRISFFCLGLALLVGCSTATERSDQVNQARIHQSYSLRYDRSLDRTSATAEFRFGDGSGTTLRLVGKSNVTNDAVTLREENILGTSYRGSRNGYFGSSTFRFTDGDGRVFSNSLSLSPISFVPPAQISRRAGLTVAWIGEPMAAGEEVTISVRDAEGNSAYGYARGVGSTSATIRIGRELKNGRGVIQLSREKHGDLRDKNSVGGDSSVEYLTEAHAIEIID